MIKNNFIMYLRKSTQSEDRQVLSIPAQERELKALAERLKLHVIGPPLQEAMTAKKPGRPLFGAMLERIRSGEATGILCWHPDRLARNPLDGGTLIWMLGEGQIQEIVTPGGTYTSTSDSKLMLNIHFGMATKYVDDLSVNVRRGLREALERGLWPNTPKLGYVRDHNSMQLVPDPERYDLVRDIWRLRLAGVSVQEILQTCRLTWKLTNPERRRKGGRLMSHAQLYRLLKDPFYAGRMVSRGRSFPGSHPPMVTWSEFERVQQEFRRGYHVKTKKPLAFTYRGLIGCGACSAMLTAEEKTNRYGDRYIYYRCCRKNLYWFSVK